MFHVDIDLLGLNREVNPETYWGLKINDLALDIGSLHRL
jgi:hypothetical protein